MTLPMIGTPAGPREVIKNEMDRICSGFWFSYIVVEAGFFLFLSLRGHAKISFLVTGLSQLVDSCQLDYADPSLVEHNAMCTR